MKPPFRFSASTRVGFSDTDAQSIVYYGRYMPYFDLARVEYHRNLQLMRVEDFDFVMRAMSIEYLAPARFDDLIEIHCRVAKIGRTSVIYEFAAYQVESDLLLVTAEQTLVLVDLEARRAAPIPDFWREKIQQFER